MHPRIINSATFQQNATAKLTLVADEMQTSCSVSEIQRFDSSFWRSGSEDTHYFLRVRLSSGFPLQLMCAHFQTSVLCMKLAS